MCARPIIFETERTEKPSHILISTHSYLLYSSYDDGDETLHGSLLSARLRYSTCHGSARTLRVIHPFLRKGVRVNNNGHFVREKWVSKVPLFTTSGCHCQTSTVVTVLFVFGAQRPHPPTILYGWLYSRTSPNSETSETPHHLRSSEKSSSVPQELKKIITNIYFETAFATT